MKNFRQAPTLSIPILFAFCIAMCSVGWTADYLPPRSSGLAGSGHAAPLLTDSIYLNPSFLAFQPSYIISLSYAPYSGDPTHGHLLNAAVVDGHSELFTGGLGYTRRDDAHIFSAAGGKAVTSTLGIGVGAKLAIPNSNGAEKISDFSISGTYLINAWLTVSATVSNIIESEGSRNLQFLRSYELGSKINLEGFAILYLDPSYTPHAAPGSEFGQQVGLEIPVFTDLFLRAGYFRNTSTPILDSRSKGYSAGAGWVAPKLSLDYGFVHSTEPETVSVHSMGFSIYF